MKVVPDRIVPLGFGKYVRADRIVGLIPIEDDRGPATAPSSTSRVCPSR